jgi:hypothetical protein
MFNGLTLERIGSNSFISTLINSILRFSIFWLSIFNINNIFLHSSGVTGDSKMHKSLKTLIAVVATVSASD